MLAAAAALAAAPHIQMVVLVAVEERVARLGIMAPQIQVAARLVVVVAALEL